MTAAEDRPPVVADAWRELEALAVAMRRDWDPAAVRDALIAAHAAWPFEKAARELWRVTWDPDGEPADLRNSIRAERPYRTGGTGGREAFDRGLAAMKARATGPQQAAGAPAPRAGGP